MKVLLVHERYIRPGGEDEVFRIEASLLEQAGHQVVPVTEDNRRIPQMRPWTTAAATLWNAAACRRLRRLVQRHRPDVAHFHNTFPLISPAALRAVHRAGVPVVQTLHNFRLLCLNALFLRRGGPCRACLGHLPWRGVLYGCYRSSRPASAVLAAMIATHRRLGTWSRYVDAFITLTRFAREQFVAGGLPEARLHLKPNFLLDDPGPGDGGGGYALFVGRLAPEKGIDVLCEAWERLGAEAPRLLIVGDGPLLEEVRRRAESSERIEVLGQQPKQRVTELMQNAAFLVVPSIWFEGMPMVILEALACGLPVLASDHGGLPELVTPERSGWLIPPGEPEVLARTVAQVVAAPERLGEMRQAARRDFEENYTARRNLQRLTEIYVHARRRHEKILGAE